MTDMQIRRPLTEQEQKEAELLRRAWENYKLKNKGATQAWLAAEAGIGTQGAVGQYLLGKIPLNVEALFAICRVIQTPPSSISPRLTQQLGFSKEAPNAENVVTKGKLPLISDIQAGNWSEVVDNFHPSDAEEWIACPFNHGPNSFVLRVVGYSMYNPGGDKSYSPGEYIAVDPSREPQNKSMVVARVDHEDKATFKQILIDGEGPSMLQALNPSHTPRLMSLPPGSRIVGVVIGKWVPE